ncbi:hypothetical protein J7E88_32495 [Streptomyces sp. ISL-10]|uniref:hypothetical protein n=1 Tax=Streptomyces sp. ISL-10 TaxID=2819172 RepID=UPI001BE55B66|nr:hypothetical protein [Streptomyces sp. ISL-10]MBT2369866.1 hypothetical protein [Streptomyces sp. ISL-10]
MEMYDDYGRSLVLVPVEIRGRGFDGALSSGDRVRVGGRVRSGTLRAPEVQNLTTGAVVSAKHTPKIVVGIAVVLFLAWIVFIIVLVSG